MHEMQRAIGNTKRQSDMRSRIQMPAIPRNNANDIAAAQFPFDGRDATLRNLVERAARDTGFHLPQRPKQ